MKRQPTEWGKIFANDMTDKGLISKTSHTTQHHKNQTTQLKKGRKSEQTFFQRRRTDG